MQCEHSSSNAWHLQAGIKSNHVSWLEAGFNSRRCESAPVYHVVYRTAGARLPVSSLLLSSNSRSHVQTYRQWTFTSCCRYYADVYSQGTGGVCNKDAYQRRQMSPGLFVLHCMGCKNCIGFHMMAESESPRTLFEVLYTRFPTAPRLVVYDNSCHAHAFALNREPEFFRNTQFCIDALHFKGHTGCCAAYNIKHHAHTRGLNSQLAEQQVRPTGRLDHAFPCCLLQFKRNHDFVLRTQPTIVQ